MINKLLNKIGFQLIKKYSSPEITVKETHTAINKPKLIGTDEKGKLYQCDYDMKLYLDPISYVDAMILQHNIWEKESVHIVQLLVKESDVVLDVGANFGYYSLLFSKLVGLKGMVIASEPTVFFRERLNTHIKTNAVTNVKVLPFGFSDKDDTLDIKIDASTATMHMPETDSFLISETIELITLDKHVKENKIEKLDFIKVDIDGHEPQFLKGAAQTISQFKPDILLEINPINYYLAGVAIWDFYDQIKSLGYNIFHEKTKHEITTKLEFLKKCGNFSWQGTWDTPFSVNVLLSIKNPF